MTDVLITIDTELSASRHRAGMSLKNNLDSAIFGRCSAGEFGIICQMDMLDSYGLKGVFFVDPMPALLGGPDIIARITTPILERGHDVQLHIHTEWLDFAADGPVGQRRGRNIADFTLEDQITLLGLAADLLTRSGAPRPTAFRAGNYGANDDTLRALKHLNISYDSSFNPAYIGNPCEISLGRNQTAMVSHHDVLELPISAIHDVPYKLRHAQICALSRWEMQSALRHAAKTRQPYFTIVSHSFELLSRDRSRSHPGMLKRFEAMCRGIAEDDRLNSVDFRTLIPHLTPNAPRLPDDPVRTLRRIAAQMLNHWRYERG